MERRARVIGCLTEGNSIRATVRLTGVAKNIITKLLLDLGIACSDYQDRTLRNLTCQRVQVDRSGPSWGPRGRTSSPSTTPTIQTDPLPTGVWLACGMAVPAGAAATDAGVRSGPKRNSVPQITAPAAKMAAATQNPVV
jgi:hypothetical protein